jgi:hypothetical protein
VRRGGTSGSHEPAFDLDGRRGTASEIPGRPKTMKPSRPSVVVPVVDVRVVRVRVPHRRVVMQMTVRFAGRIVRPVGVLVVGVVDVAVLV